MVYSIDGIADFENAKIDHAIELEQGTRTTNFVPYLNITESMYEYMSEALPMCYDFLDDVIKVQRERFKTFESSWGNFFLAFLFNQMGNALTFQSIFERIQLHREKQLYSLVWQEYGQIIFLIFNF